MAASLLDVGWQLQVATTGQEAFGCALDPTLPITMTVRSLHVLLTARREVPGSDVPG